MAGNRSNVHVVKRKLADGTTKLYYYDRRTRQALDPETLAPKGSLASGRWPAGSFGAVVDRFRAVNYPSYAGNTKRIYDNAVDILTDFMPLPIDGLRRRHVYAIRDGLVETPAVANQVVTFISSVLAWALDREMVETNVAYRIKKFDLGTYEPWTLDEIDYACERFAEPMRRGLLVGLYTGQRQGDCVAMRWSQWDGNALSLTQEKTDEPLWVPCARAFKEELREWKAEARSVTILRNSFGRPWPTASFQTSFSKECRKHGIEKVYHGLRKTACKTLAEAGCTAHEIMAITGHQTLEMVQLYTQAVERKKNASAAILKLENAGVKRAENT